MSELTRIDVLLSQYSEIIKEIRTREINRRLAEFAAVTNELISNISEVLGFEYEGHYDHEKAELTMKFY